MNDDELLYFNTEYSPLQRYVFCADITKNINPNASLGQSRLVLEFLINSMIFGQKENKKGTLVSHIIELETVGGVEKEIIDAMHEVRLLGNVGVHGNMVFWKEADRALKTLVKIMHWYGDSNHRLIQDKNFLADVQFCLSKCYENGICVEADDVKQVEWLKKSCDNGSLFAARDLGVIYFYGEKLPKDIEKAEEFLQKAVDKGSSDAEYFLGYVYMNKGGDGERNQKIAYDLWKSSVKKGNLLAEYTLFEYFDFIKKNLLKIPYIPEEEFAAYNHIVEEGRDNAIYKVLVSKTLIRLGDCYQHGMGTAANLEAAFDCYLKASELKNAAAYYKLAQCYENGKGTEKNFDKAMECYSLASFLGHNGANGRVNQLKYREKYGGKKLGRNFL